MANEGLVWDPLIVLLVTVLGRGPTQVLHSSCKCEKTANMNVQDFLSMANKLAKQI